MSRDREPRGSRGGNNRERDAKSSSTLFVGNVPADASDREVRHIFFPFPGFRTSAVFPKGPGKVMCFARFNSVRDAEYAKEMLSGYLFDEGSTGLRVEFAKTELQPKSSSAPSGSTKTRDAPRKDDRRDDRRDRGTYKPEPADSVW